MRTMIYVIGNRAAAGVKKVGISATPSKRCSALARAGLRKLKVLYSRDVPIAIASNVEGHAHFLLKDFMRQGEWFDVTLQQARDAVDTAANLSGGGEQAKRVVGRKKQWTERIQLPLAEGTTERIDSVLEPDEVRLDLIRAAIERELKRREKTKKTQGE
jgi:hypothetical protein